MRNRRTDGIPGGVVSAVEADVPDARATRALLSRLAAELGLSLTVGKKGRTILAGPDGVNIAPWREDYPYAERLRRREYESAKSQLQIELLKLQRSVKADGGRVLIVFEGRDAAGKGGTIRRFTENLNPRGVRVVALDKPADDDQGDNYLPRYRRHLPSAGEIVLFDRSWYNRAGVEVVMGFCPQLDYARFLRDAPAFERQLVADGITVIKLWFSVTRAEQLRRFVARQEDPVKCWKLSPTDLASLDKWSEYTRAKEAMFRHTDVPEAPWTVIKSNDKKRARLEAMRYVLSLFDYPGRVPEVIGQPDPLIVGPAAVMAEGRAEPVVLQVPLSRLCPAAGLAGVAGAEPAHLVQRDSGGDTGVQRLGAGHRDLDDRVALLCDEPG
jgi:polyphosphate kinase